MTDRLELLDYYTLLGVDPDASGAEVKRAFRRFARRYHPDRFAGGDEEKRARATQIYRRGSEAYQVLTDPVSRRAYDRVLRAGKVRLDSDEQEREHIRERAAAAPRKPQAPIRSPQAHAFYQRAAEAARGGRWRDAWRAMKTALELEPDNRLLRTRLSQIEARIRTRR
ncbi:MAG TPA: DnaJ domain-containing protein [Sandaracinaceae bacterium LLY-WYZ-13_1]|nr:DnaJ domain-containing protein [Sandaracinaceae bacterium LLY-WYZ-13_1]